MAYARTNWDELVAITPDRLNNIEQGIADANANIEAAKTPIANALSSKGISVNSSDSFSTMADKINAVPVKSGIIYMPVTSDQLITSGIEDGTCKVKGDSNLIAANILNGKSIFGVSGSFIPEYWYFTTNVTFGSVTTISGLPFTPKQIIISCYSQSTWNNSGTLNNIAGSLAVTSGNLKTISLADCGIYHYYSTGWDIRNLLTLSNVSFAAGSATYKITLSTSYSPTYGPSSSDPILILLG